MNYLSFSATVVTKARDAIEPLVMTQIVTKAREVGKFVASELVYYIFTSLYLSRTQSYT